jgi:hypothetical protein
LAQLQNPANYVVQTATNTPGGASPIADLDLRLVNADNNSTVAYVLSFKDNVEHLYFNVRQEGHYNLVVDNRSNLSVPYGLAISAGSSDGMAFTVDHNSQGLQMPAFGGNAGSPNDVNSLGHAGQGNFDIGGEIFSSSLNGTNMQRVSGALGTKSRVGPHLAVPAAQNLLDGSLGALGLQSGDLLTGLSWGRDGSRENGVARDSTVTFSVDEASTGTNGTDVAALKAVSSQAGYIFKTPELPAFGQYNSARLNPAPQNSNKTYITAAQLGLWAPNSGVPSLIPGAKADNLRDFDHDNIRSYVDTDGDGMINGSAFFCLDRTSPTVIAAGATADDILMCANQDPSANFDTAAPAGGFHFTVRHTGADIGLAAGDEIDGLIFSMGAAANQDEALFSLDPNSPDVLNGNALAGAIYYTNFDGIFLPMTAYDPINPAIGGSLFASPAQLGLAAGDNIDGLDIFSVPEPSSLAVLAFGALLIRRRRAPRS